MIGVLVIFKLGLFLLVFKLSGYGYTVYAFRRHFWYKSYGENCLGFSECNYGNYLVCTANQEKGFKTCSCLGNADTYYDKNAEVKCYYPLLFILRKGRTCKMKCRFDQVCNNKGVCSCKNDKMVMINQACYHVEYMEPLESCYVDSSAPYVHSSAPYVYSSAHLCDYRNYSVCRNNKCVCFRDYFYNTTSRACERKYEALSYSGYGSKYYKAVLGEYCLLDSDCADGLKCNQTEFNCTCQSPCKYLEEDGVCDCRKPKTPMQTIYHMTPMTPKESQSKLSIRLNIFEKVLGVVAVSMFCYCLTEICQKRKVKQPPRVVVYHATNIERTNEHPGETIRPQDTGDLVIVDEEANQTDEANQNQVAVKKEKDLPPSYSDVEALIQGDLPSYSDVMSNCDSDVTRTQHRTFYPPPPTNCEFTSWNAGGTSSGITHQDAPLYRVSQANLSHPFTQTTISFPVTSQTDSPATVSSHTRT